MNPFKPKHPTRNKLLSRFNISMNSRNQPYTSNGLNSSIQLDDNLSRYKNHINFLQCRIEQQQVTIDKLHLQIQTNINNQSKLNAQILRLQRDNKNMLNNLYMTQNRVNQLEQQHNNQMLHQSIEKIQHQLSMSQIRKRNKTLEDLDNPQKIKLRKTTMKTSQMVSNESQQPSFKFTSFTNPFKFSSQIFHINIKGVPITKDDQLTKKLQQKQKTILQSSQRNKKLQQAIYYLKKQLKQTQKQYKNQITQLKNQKQFTTLNNKIQHHQTISNQLHIKIKQSQQFQQLQQKLILLQKKLQQKDKQLLQIQLKYNKQLKQSQQIVISLNQSIKIIINKKQQQMDILKQQLIKNKIFIQNINNQNSSLKQQIKRLQGKKQDNQIVEQSKEQLKCIELQQQIQDINKQKQLIRSQLDKKQQQLKQLTQKFNKKQQQLLTISSKSESKQQQQQNNSQLIIIQQLTSTIKLLQQQLHHKQQQILQHQQTSTQLYNKLKTLQSLNTQIQQKQHNLSLDLHKITQKMYDLQNDKQGQIKQIQKLLIIIRRCQGQIAQKQQLVGQMTDQLIIIKQKLQIQKLDKQIQTQIITIKQQQQQQCDKLNIEQLQQHFSQILSQKQQDQNILHNQLEKSHGICQHLQKQLNTTIHKYQEKQIIIQELEKKIQELEENIHNYQNQIYQYKQQIVNLKKNVCDLEEKQAFLQQYIERGKTVDV